MHVGYGSDNKASSSLPFSQSTLQQPCETRQVVVTVPVTTRRGAGPAQGEDLLQDLAEYRTCWSSGRADLAGPAGGAAERAASWKRLGRPPRRSDSASGPRAPPTAPLQPHAFPHYCASRPSAPEARAPPPTPPPWSASPRLRAPPSPAHLPQVGPRPLRTLPRRSPPPLPRVEPRPGLHPFLPRLGPRPSAPWTPLFQSQGSRVLGAADSAE